MRRSEEEVSEGSSKAKERSSDCAKAQGRLSMPAAPPLEVLRYWVFFAESTASPAWALLSVVAPAVSTGMVAVSVGVILSRVR